MYDGAETIQVRAPVRYQDGSEGFVETDIRVMILDAAEGK